MRLDLQVLAVGGKRICCGARPQAASAASEAPSTMLERKGILLSSVEWPWAPLACARAIGRRSGHGVESVQLRRDEDRASVARGEIAAVRSRSSAGRWARPDGATITTSSVSSFCKSRLRNSAPRTGMSLAPGAVEGLLGLFLDHAGDDEALPEGISTVVSVRRTFRAGMVMLLAGTSSPVSRSVPATESDRKPPVSELGDLDRQLQRDAAFGEDDRRIAEADAELLELDRDLAFVLGDRTGEFACRPGSCPARRRSR